MAYKELVEGILNMDWMLVKLQPAIPAELGITLKAKAQMSSRTFAEVIESAAKSGQGDKVEKFLMSKGVTLDDSIPFAHMHVCYFQDVDLEEEKLLWHHRKGESDEQGKPDSTSR